ncbi:hypothetical protein F0562_025627 [Nyssa sinensis]|uniref:DUF4283 domain-containing protein n=1 Tax=Nyssa sinensis TaxID=561372 RepID=A0A5J5B6U3_9ASTE|nr:hypothetical protein F0562_025627 [Nyssa sinensis]
MVERGFGVVRRIWFSKGEFKWLCAAMIEASKGARMVSYPRFLFGKGRSLRLWKRSNRAGEFLKVEVSSEWGEHCIYLPEVDRGGGWLPEEKVRRDLVSQLLNQTRLAATYLEAARIGGWAHSALVVQQAPTGVWEDLQVHLESCEERLQFMSRGLSMGKRCWGGMKESHVPVEHGETGGVFEDRRTRGGGGMVSDGATEDWAHVRRDGGGYGPKGPTPGPCSGCSDGSGGMSSQPKEKEGRSDSQEILVDDGEKSGRAELEQQPETHEGGEAAGGKEFDVQEEERRTVEEEGREN